MATHEVRAKIHSKVIANKDLEISVKANGRKLGTLLVSKGNLEWLPRGKHVNKKRLSWGRFAKIIKAEGRTVKARK